MFFFKEVLLGSQSDDTSLRELHHLEETITEPDWQHTWQQINMSLIKQKLWQQ
jgi:hypothetical protein